MNPKLALATCREFPDLHADDHPIVARLAAHGVRAEPAIWNDDVDWSDYAAVVLRSTWDYHLDVAAFFGWLDRLDRMQVPSWNPTSLVRWNLDKRYLKELAGDGIATVPTLWIERGVASDEAVKRILATGWPDVVLKPAVSAGAWKTLRLARSSVEGQATYVSDVLAEGTLMAQPFLPEIVAEGEYSFVFFDGAFSHAVLKRPKGGDFRVQWSHGGSQIAVTPAPEILEQASAVLDASPSIELYGRVDAIVRDGRLIVVELELIEPYLFLSDGPGAVDRYVEALLARL